jgi:MFS family permease
MFLQRRRLIIRVGELGLVRVMLAIGLASINTVWALHIKNLSGSEALVGLITSIFSVVAILSSFLLVPLFQRESPRTLLFLSMVVSASAYIFLPLVQSIGVFIACAAALVVVEVARIASVGVLVREQVSRKDISNMQAVMYVFANIGWVIGPLIAGIIAARQGVTGAFWFSAIVFGLCGILVLVFPFKEENHRPEKGNRIADPWKNAVAFWKDQRMRMVYLMDLGMQLWWAFIFIFLPLYIVREGLPLVWVGYFFFANTLPLVFLEGLSSKFIDRFGHRKLFMAGFSILAASALACFFVDDPVWVLSIMVASSGGAALLEPTIEGFFFHQVKKGEERRFYAPYSTSAQVGAMLGKLLGGIVILLFFFDAVFLMVGLMMLTACCVSFFAPRPRRT